MYSHLLFIDDILLFTNGSRRDIETLKFTLDLFLGEFGMFINDKKSSISFITLDLENVEWISYFFHFLSHWATRRT